MTKNTIKQKMSSYSIAKDMKYSALYWNLGYKEYKKDKFKKQYKTCTIYINAKKQYAICKNIDFCHSNNRLLLIDATSFVILECINQLLEIGYQPHNIHIKQKKTFQIYVENMQIACFEWDKREDIEKCYKNTKSLYAIHYSSRLYSGLIDRAMRIYKKGDNRIYEAGLLEQKTLNLPLSLFHSIILV